MRISNNSVSAAIRSFALTEQDGDAERVIVWLEIAPQHPKVVGAIWASLVNGSKETLALRTDDGKSIYARGLVRRYHRLTMDAPLGSPTAISPKFVTFAELAARRREIARSVAARRSQRRNGSTEHDQPQLALF